MTSRRKPVGVILIGAMVLTFGVVSTLIAILFALGNVLVFDITQPTWVLLVGTGIGLFVAYLAIRIGFGLLRNPAIDSRAGEVAMWIGIPIVWLAMAAINLLLTEGQDDVSVWPLVATTGVFWSALTIGAAFYMRSRGVRSYFTETDSA